MRLTVLLAWGAATFFVVDGYAAWPTDPNANLPVCTVIGSQVAPAIASDGAGGVIVAWEDDRRGGIDLYVQRIDCSGVSRWSENGVALCLEPGDQRMPQLIADGSGGAIVVWQDHRDPVGWDIYGQRVDSSGTTLWDAGGIRVIGAANDQVNARITSDGGGAIVVWEDARVDSSIDVYAQRIDPSGALEWAPAGIPVCVAPGDQQVPETAGDGEGGVVITWQDGRSGDHVDIYTQRLSADGHPAWQEDGSLVATDVGGDTHPTPVPDGAGGAIVVWDDGLIYSQRIGESGDRMWSVDGLVVSAQDGMVPRGLPDGAGGAIVTWQGDPGTEDRGDIYAQRVGFDGALEWAVGGVAVCAAADLQTSADIVSDAAGGAIITWQDRRSDDLGDIYAQRVSGTGVPQWTPDGVLVSTANGEQHAPVVVPDCAGGVIAVWQDGRDGNHIYAQRVTPSGWLGGGVGPDGHRRSDPEPAAPRSPRLPGEAGPGKRKGPGVPDSPR